VNYKEMSTQGNKEVKRNQAEEVKKETKRKEGGQKKIGIQKK
jgi:hypothetical protein